MRSLLFVVSLVCVGTLSAQDLGYRDDSGQFFVTRKFSDIMLADLVNQVTPKEYQVLYSDDVDLTKRVTTVSVMSWNQLIEAVFKGSGYDVVELSPFSIYVHSAQQRPYILGLSPRNGRRGGEPILIRPSNFLQSLDQLARLYNYQVIPGPTLKAEPFIFSEAFFLKGDDVTQDLRTLETYAKTINDRVYLSVNSVQKIIYVDVGYGDSRQLSLN